MGDMQGTFADLVPLSDVIAMTGFCRSEVYRRMGQGAFPRPRKLGYRTARWSRSQIEMWRLGTLDSEITDLLA